MFPGRPAGDLRYHQAAMAAPSSEQDMRTYRETAFEIRRDRSHSMMSINPADPLAILLLYLEVFRCTHQFIRQ